MPDPIIHVCIFQVPAPGDEAWRHAIAAKCHAQDWDYYEQFDDVPLQMDPLRNGVVVTWAVYACAAETPTWIVQSCEPALAIDTLAVRYGFSRAEAELHASGRFAEIVGLIDRGASIFDRAAPLEISPLGVVEPPEMAYQAREVASMGLLSIYETLPSSSPVVLVCPLERLALHSESVETTPNGRKLWLVGRRRILVQGPDIWAPAGKWVAEVELIIDAPVAVTLGLDWAGTGPVEQVFPQSGRYVVELMTERSDSVLLDLRISLLVPVLNGHLTVTALTLRKV